MSNRYDARLAMMEDWYRELVRQGQGEQLLLEDYAPHEGYLRSLRGAIVDIGGGAGLAARFLDRGVSYTVVDPSEVWNSPEWVELARKFRSDGPQPAFIKAFGEHLPFSDGEFDAALSFWSLNHVADPSKCVSEMIRVLKRGGTARVVIEDAEPSWADLLTDGVHRGWRRVWGRPRQARIRVKLSTALQAKLRGKWPIQEDHIRISERELRGWLRNARVERRQWLGGWLTYDLTKI